MNKPNILFLADTTHPAGAVSDHIQAITNNDRINWIIINPLSNKTVDKFDLDNFDAIGINYSIKPFGTYYLSKKLKEKISQYTGFKFLFLQDEYQKVNEVQEFLYALKFNLLFTLVNNDLIDIAYPDPRLSNLKKVTVLTGYVQDEMKFINSDPIETRPIDVSYRGRHYEYWLGKLAHEKETIANQFIKYTKNSGLTVDVSLKESDRLYGDVWFNLLKNSKAVLGTESGASIWDFDDCVRKKTNQFIRKHKDADFNLVYEHVLKPYDGQIVYNAISPRVFEAAATKTAMVMFPGFYSGVCEPNVHYIVLEKDFSNIDDVINKLKNSEYLQQIANQAHKDLIESGLYSQHVFSKLVADELLQQIHGTERSSPVDVSKMLDREINKYQYLNKLRCVWTEAKFIAWNFMKLLFSPRETFLGKIKLLSAGFQRYVSYIVPRLKSKI